MPQFDFANFVPQLAWLTLFFAILYFGIVRLTLPRIGRLVDQREATVKGDLDRAEAAKAEADRVRDAYENEMAAARAKAQTAAADAKSAAQRDTEARLAESGRGIDARAAEAAARLEAARGQALATIDVVAAEAAADIVERLSGRRPDQAAALAAARAAA